MICEVPPVALLPNFIVQRKVLKPMRIQTGGTILVKYILFVEGWMLTINFYFVIYHHVLQLTIMWTNQSCVSVKSKALGSRKNIE